MVSPCKPKLTEFSPRVGRRKRLLCHAPVEDVAVAIIRVEDRCEVPEINRIGWRAGSFPWAEGSPKGRCSALLKREWAAAAAFQTLQGGRQRGRLSLAPCPLPWKPAGDLLGGSEGEERESFLAGAGFTFVACEEEKFSDACLSHYTFKRMWPCPDPFCF